VRSVIIGLVISLSACVSSPSVQPGAPLEEPLAATPPPPEGPVDWPKMPTGTAWAIDASQSKLTFIGRKISGQHEGGFKSLSGSAIVVDGAITAADINIDINSTWADHLKLTEHLLSADFFDATQFKTARFATSDVQAGSAGTVTTHTVQGVLELRGILGRVRAPVTIEMGEEKATVHGNFQINRQQWGITYPGKPDNLIEDDVNIRIDLTFSAPNTEASDN
jgi:polyisoprenoid-binding protein YceI